jgi:hypothetical protein
MNQFTHPEGLSMLEKRKIEAEILKEVYETLKESHGEEVARKTIAESVRRSAIEQARQFAAAAPGGTSLKAFQDVMPLWTKGGALEIEVKEQTDQSFAFNVVRCRYAETYKAMGLGEIATFCRATATAPSARATTPSSSSNARRPSCRAPAIATSNIATRGNPVASWGTNGDGRRKKSRNR